MKATKYSIIALAVGLGLAACTDLDEKTYTELDASNYYQNEQSVKGAVSAIYNQAGETFPEFFYQLQEFSADQVAWRSWNAGAWGWDEAEKFVLSTHTWSPESKIINNAWTHAWSIVGLSNQLLDDLGGVSVSNKDQYVSEARLLRAWSYYALFELWGGALPINDHVTVDIPGSADADFDVSCRKIYDFIMTELDESLSALPKEDGTGFTRARMNQAVNRILKARMLLNSNIFIGEEHFAECEALCKEILNGDYGVYELAADYRDIYRKTNMSCPEIVFAFATADGQGANFQLLNNRNMPSLAYNYNEYFNVAAYDGIGAWNCTCLVPSWDNSGTVNALGGSTGAKCFLDAPYGDKLGAVYERFDDRDIRKGPYIYNPSTDTWTGMFLIGAQRANFGQGDPLVADADRQGQNLVYVDQVGTFQNLGRDLKDVMNPRWGETNSGVRLVKYPMHDGSDFKNIAEVEFRLAEVYYMIAECEMRAGHKDVAKSYVDQVRKRYYPYGVIPTTIGRGFTDYDMDWMLSEWGKEYLGEGRRRRTDLRRFDKFTQGQWWFFGRDEEAGFSLPAKRDRKYEWFPLPKSAMLVNPGLHQAPGY